MTRDGAAAELRFAVRPRVIAKYLGQLLLVLAMLTLPPLLLSLAEGETRFTLRFALVVLALVGVGIPLARLPRPHRVQTNEALTISALAFIVSALAMWWPMAAAGLAPLDALFESVSAITTTGLSSAGSIDGRPLSFLFLRAWMQWIGGLGIVVLSLALVLHPGAASRQLGREISEEEDLVGSTLAHARRVLVVYVVLTLGGMLLLAVAGARPADAVLYTLAAISTGGFAPSDESLAALGGLGLPALVLLICFAGALSLPFYRQALRGEWREIGRDVQLRALLLAVFAGTVLVAIFLRYSGGQAWSDALRQAPLLAVSAQTTAGFSALSVPALGAGPKVALMLSMFVGGGLGSTAGGIKLLRLLVLLRMLEVLVRRVSLPRHAVLTPRLAGRRLEPEEIMAVFGTVLLFVGVILLSWLPFLAFGHAPLDALFEVVSATGTVGLSAGVSSPDLSPVLKGVLCLDMLCGRLEVLPLLVILRPGTWLGRRSALS